MSPHAARRAVSAVFFANGAALGGWAAHIPDAKVMLGLTDRGLGLALLASAAGAISTMPLAGPLVHRFGSRRLAFFGGIALCAVVPLLFLAPSLPAFVAILYLVGVSNGQMDVGMNAHSMAVQDRIDRPILSAIHGWFSVGGFAGGAGASFAAWLGIAPIFHLASASLVLAMLLIVSRRHLLPADVDKAEEGAKLALPRGRLWLLGIFITFAFVSEGAAWDWSAVYLRDVLRTEAWIGALGFGLFSLAMAVGRFLGDDWTHRLGRRRLFLISALASGVGLLLAVNVPTPALAVAGFAVAGMAMANLVPIMFRAAAQVPGVSASFGLAAVTTCGYTGFLGGPPVVGLIAQARSLAFAMGAAAILCLIIAVSTNKVVPEEE
ncbi:MAG: MFS transporter [Fimbriimonas sp.]